MNVSKLAKYLGMRGAIAHPNGLSFPVEIRDARTVYGRVQVEVTPTPGSGRAWVDLSSVRFLSAPSHSLEGVTS